MKNDLDLKKIGFYQRAWERSARCFLQDTFEHVLWGITRDSPYRFEVDADLRLQAATKIDMKLIQDTQLATCLTRRGWWPRRRDVIQIHFGFLHLIDDVAQIIAFYDLIEAGDGLGPNALQAGEIPTLIKQHARYCADNQLHWKRINPLAARRPDLEKIPGRELGLRHTILGEVRFLLTFFMLAHEIAHSALDHLSLPDHASAHSLVRYPILAGHEHDADIFALIALLNWIETGAAFYSKPYTGEAPAGPMELHRIHTRLVTLFGLTILFTITDEVTSLYQKNNNIFHLDTEHPPGWVRNHTLFEIAILHGYLDLDLFTKPYGPFKSPAELNRTLNYLMKGWGNLL